MVSTHEAYYFFLDFLLHWGQGGGMGSGGRSEYLYGSFVAKSWQMVKVSRPCQWILDIATSREGQNKPHKEKTEKWFRDCRILGMIVMLYPHCGPLSRKEGRTEVIGGGASAPFAMWKSPLSTWRSRGHHREWIQPCGRGAGAIKAFVQHFFSVLLKEKFLYWFKVCYCNWTNGHTLLHFNLVAKNSQ